MAECEITRTPVEIVAACPCGSGIVVPNKGLGRATVAAWETRHRECGEVEA